MPLTDSASSAIERTIAPPEASSTAACERETHTRRPFVLTCVTIFILGAGISWLRLPATTRGTMWAEDVRNFIGNAVQMGPVAPLLHPYAGYLQLVPRLIADTTVGIVPVSGWAYSMCFGSCLVTAGCAVVVYVCSRDVTTNPAVRLLFAAITILDPLSPREVLGNTANLHWYFLWMTPWLLLYRPRTRAGAWVLGVIALLAAMSEIQMALFFPLVLWRWRDRARIPLRLLYLAGVLAQALATLAVPRTPSSAHPIGPASLAYGFLINCVTTIYDPNPKAVGDVLTAGGPILALVMLVPFVVAGGYVARRGTPHQRLLAVSLIAGSLILYPLAVEISPGTFYGYASMTHTQLSDPWLARYGVVPSMFLLALIPLAIVVFLQQRGRPLPPRPGSQARAAIPWIATIALILVLTTHLVPETTRRSNGPVWATQVMEKAATCSAGSTVTLVGAPGPNWKVDLNCSDLRRDR